MEVLNMTDTIMNELICLIFSIVAAVASSVLIPALSAWLRSKTENEKLQAVISDITTTVQTSVNKYEQNVFYVGCTRAKEKLVIYDSDLSV